MNYIDFSSSMTMIELVSYLLEGTNNSFSFYCGKICEGCYNSSELTEVSHYLCAAVRKSWHGLNIGIIAVESGDVMLAVTSAQADVPHRVTGLILRALIDYTSDPNEPPRWTPDDETMTNVPADMVQITATTMKEMNKRIKRFIQHKREEANITNVMEFCGARNQGCARADSVLVRIKDSKSHVAVRSVYGRYFSAYSAD